MEINVANAIAEKSLESLDAAVFLIATGAILSFVVTTFVKGLK